MSDENLRCYVLFFKLPQLRRHLFEVGMCFAFRMGEWLLNHQKLIELMRHVEIGLADL